MNPLAAIHIAKKQLGLDDDTYRAVLVRVTGKSSAAAMSQAELGRVLDEFRSKGFRPASKGGRKPLEGRFAKKLQALWIAAWNLGLVRNRDDAALIAFAERQTGISHVRFLQSAADARKVIEALKAWMVRDAGVDWTFRPEHDILRHECGAIAWAQYRLLVPGATLIGNGPQFRREVMLAGGAVNAELSLGLLSNADWRRVMNTFGKRVRAMKEAA